MGWFTKKPIIKENNPGLLDIFGSFVGWGGRTEGYRECTNMSRYEYAAHVKGISLEQFRTQMAAYLTHLARFERYKAVQLDIQDIRRSIRECPKRGLSKEVKDKLVEYDAFLVEKLAWVKNNLPSVGPNPAQDPNPYSDKAWPTKFSKGDDLVSSPAPSTPELHELKVKLKEIRDFVESASEKPLAEKRIAEEALRAEADAKDAALRQEHADEIDRRSRWVLVDEAAVVYARNLRSKNPTAIRLRDEALAKELTRVKGMIAQTRTELEEIFKSEYIDEQITPVLLKGVSESATVNAQQLPKHVDYLKALCDLFPK